MHVYSVHDLKGTMIDTDRVASSFAFQDDFTTACWPLSTSLNLAKMVLDNYGAPEEKDKLVSQLGFHFHIVSPSQSC